MGRVKWAEHEKVWIAKHVAKAILNDGHDLDWVLSKPNFVLLPYVRSVVERMTEDRQREIKTVAHVDWLPEKVYSWMENDVDHTISDHIETIHEEFLEDKVDRLIRIERKNRRILRSLQDRLASIEDLLLEVLAEPKKSESPGPQSNKGEEYSATVDHSVSTDNSPAPKKVAVVGLRRHQFEILKKMVGQTTDIILYDHRKSPPETSKFDKVVAMRTTPSKWIREAQHSLGKKFAKVKGVTDLLKVVKGDS